MNDFQRTMTDDEVLKISLEELHKAHKEIYRLVKLDEKNEAIIAKYINSSEHSDLARGILDERLNRTRFSSRYAGLNAMTKYIHEKKYDHAFVWALALRSHFVDNVPFLKTLRDIQTKRGEISDSLLLSNEIARRDTRTNLKQMRRLEGRLREISGWVPRIPGPVVPVSEPIAGRVLHLVKESRPYLSNGFTSRSHRNFCAEADAGLEPIVVTEPGFPRSQVGSQFPHIENVDGIKHLRLDIGDIDYNSMPVDEYLQMFADLAYLQVRKYRPSIIHASSGRRGFDTALVGLALKEKTGLPFVYEVRSFFEANWTGDIEWESKGEVFARRMATEELCMQKADKVLTIGYAMKAELVSRGIPAEKIGIIPNAVDTQMFAPQDRSRRLAELHDLRDYPTFGYVSNMDHYRESQETLIKACHRLSIEGSQARCVLVGSGPREAELRHMAETLGVSDRVIFVGSVDHKEIAEYYSLIDIFVVPRVAERAAYYVTPLKPFEAMAMGIPVITSDLPALVEVVSPPNRGLTFAAGDENSLAGVLERMFNDPEECKRIADAGLSWVKAERTWDKNGIRYAEEFQMTEVKD